MCGLVACWLLGASAVGADLVTPLLPLPSAAFQGGVSPVLVGQGPGASAPIVPQTEVAATTRPASARRPAVADEGLTMLRRRWRMTATTPGGQPSTWGLSGDVSVNLSLGLESEVFYSDNLAFAPNDQASGATVFEISPILRIDAGDPQDGSGSASRLSEYYAGLLYVPTLHHVIDEGSTEYLQHFFSEVGRMTELSRVSFRLDYDERIGSSSDITSPEDTYTLLEASSLLEYRFTPKTMLRTKGTYREITVADSFSDRSTWIGEAALEWAATAKTTAGLGTEIGHIAFDQAGVGTQDYQQALFIFRWRPTAKLSFSSRAGAERRAFDARPSRGTHVSPVAAAVLQWQAAEKTRVSARLRVGNEPSIVEQGALFQEVRFATDLVHDISAHWYTSGELQITGRDYDTGLSETEPGARLAVGFREDPDKMSNHLNIELYFQWRRRVRSGISLDADRSHIGLQVTKYF
jgi:hypothetical protein